MIENISSIETFDYVLPREIEQKLLPIFPEQFIKYRHEARPIEQFYLSHPDEDFSLRLREELVDGELCYTATLKDRGELTPAGIDRLEVETTIQPETYTYYKSDETPLLRKLRATPEPNIAIDFFDDGHIQIECENAVSFAPFREQLIDISGDKLCDNEWRAHVLHRREHAGHDVLLPLPELDTQAASREIIQLHESQAFSVVQIAGRSGSGKSTYVARIREQLEAAGIDCDVISTDDYHRGATWLRAYNGGRDWVRWDDAIVYDTAALASDIDQLRRGNSVPHRRIDFTIAEPVYAGARRPTPVLIVEGIYSRSPELTQLYDLTYEVPTPLATCIGRRLLRDLSERPQFADPTISLRYMLEEAKPAWRKQTT